jgi:hypothetical protein
MHTVPFLTLSTTLCKISSTSSNFWPSKVGHKLWMSAPRRHWRHILSPANWNSCEIHTQFTWALPTSSGELSYTQTHTPCMLPPTMRFSYAIPSSQSTLFFLSWKVYTVFPYIQTASKGNEGIESKCVAHSDRSVCWHAYKLLKHFIHAKCAYIITYANIIIQSHLCKSYPGGTHTKFDLNAAFFSEGILGVW